MKEKESASKRPENTSEQSPDYRVEFAPRALRDIGDASLWLADEASSGVAERWRDGIFNKIDALVAFPDRCPLAGETDREGGEVRQLFYGEGRGQYRVLFAIRGDVVRILAVRHSARARLEL